MLGSAEDRERCKGEAYPLLHYSVTAAHKLLELESSGSSPDSAVSKQTICMLVIPKREGWSAARPDSSKRKRVTGLYSCH